MIFPPNTRLVAYLRDSGGRDQDLSIAQQQQAIGNWCREHDCILTRVFADVARSGTTTVGRDQFLDMVEYLDGNTEEKGVLLYELARFSRSFDDAVYYLADLRRHGYTVFSLSDPVPNTLDGRLLESLVAWNNAKYSADLSRQVKRGIHYAIIHHHAYFGPAPAGYQNVKATVGTRRDNTPHVISRLEPDPDTAPLVQRAFEMRANGATYREVSLAVGLYTWSFQFHAMFRNLIYIGQRLLDNTLIPDFCTPLIDMDTWERVQLVNEERARRHGYNHPRSVRSRFILTGLITCQLCGHAMCGSVCKRKDKPPLEYYRCQRTNNTTVRCTASLIPKDLVEQRVIQLVRDHALVPDVMEDAYNRAKEMLSSGDAARQAQLTGIKREIITNNAHIVRIIAAIKDAGHSSSLLETLETLETKKRKLDQSLAQLESQRPRELPPFDAREVASLIRSQLGTLDYRDIATVLRGIVVNIRAVKPRHQPLSGTLTYRVPVAGVTQEYCLSLDME